MKLSVLLLLIPASAPSQHLLLPLSFEINQGQFNPQVKFLTHSGGGAVYFTSNGPAFSLERHGAPPQLLRMNFSGANPAANISGVDLLPGRSNYLLGNDPRAWRTGVPTYSKIKYSGIYPGIDVLYYGNQRQLEYDLVVAPGADPRRIRLHFDNARRLLIRHGDLVVETAGESLRLHKPVVYQPRNSEPIAASFSIFSASEAAFEVGAYDPSQPLIIDPVISYSTYLGGSASDSGKGIAVDSAGNAYVTGQTNSIDFPTVPQYEDAFGGGYNIFVTKLNPAGTALLYSTTIGGSGDDFGYAIAIDSSGSAYITGVTNSINFPIAGGFQKAPSTITNLNGATTPFNQAFVLKLNPAGTALTYSSYLGGSANDYGRGIAVDPSGNAYVIGNAYSFNFPVVNAIQSKKGDLSTGTADVFVAKINPAGSALVYATYLGGAGDDEGAGIAVDAAGNAYITGETISPDFPVVKPLQGSRAGNPNSAFYDAFVAKINSAGTALVYSTYLGGSNTDAADGIAVDSMGNAYIAGYTYSRDFPVLPAQTVSGTAFAAKLSSDGSALVYSRSFGGNGTDTANGIAVDGAGDAYVTGVTSSTNFPAISAPESLTSLLSAGSFQQAAFVIEINPTGAGLIYSTPFGGGADSGTGIGVDSSGNVFITGQTNSGNFPTVGPIQLNLGGSIDAFLAKLSPQSEPAPSILPGGIVNGASFVPASNPNGAIAPGALVAIFGGNLAPASRVATSLPIPTTLFDTTVTFNGVAAPLFFVSNSQINAQVPFETPLGTVTVVIQRADMTAPATQTVTVAAVSPGIFSYTQQGSTVGAILHGKDFSYVTAASPAIAGETLSLFTTGLGALQQPVATGAVPPSPPPMTVATPTVTIGGTPATVTYSGLAARLAGVYQVNVVMPAVPATTATTPVQITINGVPSNSVMINVQ